MCIFSSFSSLQCVFFHLFLSLQCVFFHLIYFQHHFLLQVAMFEKEFTSKSHDNDGGDLLFKN